MCRCTYHIAGIICKKFIYLIVNWQSEVLTANIFPTKLVHDCTFPILRNHFRNSIHDPLLSLCTGDSLCWERIGNECDHNKSI